MTRPITLVTAVHGPSAGNPPDVYDSLGSERPPTAELGVSARINRHRRCIGAIGVRW